MSETARAVNHLIELRRRLIFVLISVGLGAIVTFANRAQVFDILLNPLRGITDVPAVVFTGVTDVFFVSFKLALYGGIFCAVPVLVYQIWAFVKPGLRGRESLLLMPFLVLTPVLFYAGVVFSYLLIVPLALEFFFQFGAEQLPALPTLQPYLSLVTKLLFAFGLAFTFPMCVLLFVQLGFVSLRTLQKSRRWLIVILFVVAAILTPPDPMTQVLLAVPLYLLFEMALLLAKLVAKPAQ